MAFIKKTMIACDYTDLEALIRKVYGVSVRLDDFNEVLEGWSNRIEAQIKDELEYLQQERAVAETAEKLITERLEKARDILDSIESDTWKLYGQDS